MQKKEHKSLFAYLAAFAKESGEALFLHDETQEITAGEALVRVRSLAGFFYAHGVRAGSYVALRITRSPQAVLLFYALTALGAVTVLTDPHAGVKEALVRSGVDLPVSFYVTDEGSSCRPSARGHFLLLCAEGEFPVGEGEDAVLFEDVSAPSVVIFTSGSTGQSKAVLLSQSNLISHYENHIHAECYLKGDDVLGVLPLNHVFGLIQIVTAAIAKYAVFFPERLEVGYLLQCMRSHKITRLDGVPSLYRAFAEASVRLGAPPPMRAGLIGGAPITPEQLTYIEDALRTRMIPVYGMSECISIACARLSDPLSVRAGSVGRFQPLNRGAILSEEGEEVGTGVVGEICVSGPQVMLGYFGDEAPALDEKGFLHTGDLGYLDEAGLLHVSGRKKDIIIRNGVNLSARRIEGALLGLAAVRDAAVVGVSHALYGEAPCALVVLKEEAEPALLKEQLKGTLAKNELPERILFAECIPLTSSGKPDKQKIKELFL